MKKSFALLSIIFLSFSSYFGFSSEIDSNLVDAIIPQYLKMQSALADDSLEQVQESAKQLVHSLHHDNHGQNPMLHKLMAATKSISEAKQLADARKAFSLLSNRLIKLVEHTGTNLPNSLFVYHCPMAFEHKGASWIQASESTRNPYYGKMMLSCGSVKKSISN